ncbi:hypothetical protein BDN70DRAFT_79973 [Pholiota conissans]|uniref:BTB domain-containing protein n=1 Tax=Pholiota conissans TaxID=109636 RepID=A0A9P6CZP7_9AGAR|nr:hypothetical protein BDN70DRAFT_79973 [Pholiota conissans]
MSGGSGESLNDRVECLKDGVFYFETVIFKVEDTLFRVPKRGLNVAGTPFETMFSLPPSDSGCIDGSSDENPIVLEGSEAITKANFRAFLGAIYNFTDKFPKTYEGLIGALQLATMWEFSELRNNLIQKASPLVQSKDIHDRILVARLCKVKQWLFDAYKTLVLEKTHVDFRKLQSKGIDIQTILELLLIRDETGSLIGCPERPVYCSQCWGSMVRTEEMSNLQTDASHKINALFASEFAHMQ